jgi:hypothetical protein
MSNCSVFHGKYNPKERPLRQKRSFDERLTLPKKAKPPDYQKIKGTGIRRCL